MDIELYSVKGFTGSALKKKLEEELRQHRMPFTITEINHVDRFIKEGLASVPAFKIGEKVIQHVHDGSLEETVADVMDYILTEKVNTILVPVDFTEESTHAIAYAKMLAQHLGMGITLAHVHQTLYDPISAGALDIKLLEESNKRLLRLAEEINDENKNKDIWVPVMVHLEVGEASSSLIGILDHGHFDMMVIGTKASDSLLRRVFGTVSSDVTRHSHKPVVVVPPLTEIKFPGRMVVGFSDELLQNEALEFILSFGHKNNVIFDFIHVEENQEAFSLLKHKLQERLVLHRDELTGYNIKSVSDSQRKIHEVLFRHAHDVRAEMVILISHHRNFFENLRHSSVTKKALVHPPLPVMVIHQPAGE